MLGDVGDEALLAEVFETHRPDVVYHAAAFKHVPLMEGHPVAAARNNALATETLARLAVRFAAGQVVMVSTDKAVRPASVMGATKRVAEMALLARGDAGPRMKVLRLGNVLESRGSVVPLFRGRIARGAPLPVTDPDVRRYMMTLEESVDLILRTERLQGPGESSSRSWARLSASWISPATCFAPPGDPPTRRGSSSRDCGPATR